MLFRGGYLESQELGAYDWFIRLQPAVHISPPRIVLITVNESDIRALGWPVPDLTLARALERLAQYQPRTIGLDIYRDVPVPPGREPLDAVLARHPHIIAMIKFGMSEDSGIPLPLCSGVPSEWVSTTSPWTQGALSGGGCCFSMTRR